jgi:hypothetical protein
MPLSQGGCFVIKLHGDYRDPRILNTEEELGRYDPRMRRLLDRVLDEFGLLVVGWSATWDIALRDRIQSLTARRFTCGGHLFVGGLSWELNQLGVPARFLIHDHDDKYGVAPTACSRPTVWP